MDDNITLWDRDTIHPPLRRPHSVNIGNTDGNLEETSNTQTTNENVTKSSSLSVNAREWYPPNFNKNAYNEKVQPKSANSRLLKFKQTTSETHGQTLNEVEDDSFEQGKSLQQLEELMGNLILDPGIFDNLVGLFIDVLYPYFNDVSFVSYAAELITSKALSEPNFRYSAARLCNIIQDQCPLFRTSLCILCEKKVKEENDSNLSLLLAELYVHLNYNPIYGNLVIQNLEGVMSSADGSGIKAVCQVLKLTGATLESQHKDAVNGIFTKLIVLRNHQFLPIKNLIDSVLNLRTSKWGQLENVTNNSSFRIENIEPQDFHDGPIFYGPDGHVLTEEECRFLNENCARLNDLNDGYDDNSSEVDSEMDEEMQIAYDQFLKLQK